MFQWTLDEWIGLPIILIGIFILTIFIKRFLKDKSNKVKSAPLKIITVIIVALEIIKQVQSIIKGYSTWNIPLHYCSLFVFLFPLAQFGNSKLQNIVKPVAFTCALTMFSVFYIAPNLIIGDNAIIDFFDSFGKFHTVVYHHLVILYVTLSIALKDYVPKKSDFKYTITIMIIYFVIAIPCAYLLKTNYCNILENNIPFVIPISKFVGQYIYTIGVTCVVGGGTTLISYLYYLIYDYIERKHLKTEKDL